MTEDEKAQALIVLMNLIQPAIVSWGDRSNILQEAAWVSLESLVTGEIDPTRWVVGRYVVRDGHHEVDAEPQG